MPGIGQHKAWRQYTTDDGLAGNEVFDIILDSKGYLWFATDHGICKFNGYEFISPKDTSSLVGTEAFVPTEDSHGNIWFGRLDKSIWIVKDNVVRPWRYNHILNQYKDNFSFFDNLVVDKNETVWLALGNIGFLVVKEDGSHQVIRESNRRNLLITNVNSKIHFANQITATLDGASLGSNDIIDILMLKDGKTTMIDQVKVRDAAIENYGSAWPLGNKEFLITSNGKVFHFKDHQFISAFSSHIIAPKIIETAEGNILVAAYKGSNPGLFLYNSLDHFKENNGENILSDFLVCDILCDPEGGWWAATRERGVLYCKNPNIDVYDTSTGLPTSNVYRLTSDHKQNIYAGLWPKEVWKINSLSKQVECISTDVNPMAETWALYYDTVQQRLWRSTPLEYFDDNQWTIIYGYNSAGKRGDLIAKEISFDPSGKYFWASSTLGFYKIGIPSHQVTYMRGKENELVNHRTFSITTDYNGNTWVATIDGLRMWKEDHYELPLFQHSALKFLVSDLELLPDSSIVIALSGGGILIRKPNGDLSHVTANEGLTSNIITKIQSGSHGDFYACSDFGLNHLMKDSVQSWKVETVTMKQGLPSNLVNDLSILNGVLWVATAKGMAHIKKLPAIYAVSPPVLDKFSINNKDTTYFQDIHLSYDQNNVTIGFHSLHFRSEGNIQYRYRFSKSDSLYAYTTSRQLNFGDLSPGQYALEVQAQHEDGHWSEAALWSFRILQPWWTSWWFFSIIILLVSLAVLAIIKNRLNSIKNKATISGKIKDLELAALRAQMNPHFIFNCLGSIQQFIVENDSASATRYLARFAKLVRLALHSSIDGKHSLADEIAMLDNYLALEQMRFNGRFQYLIETAEIDDMDDIHIPPMLLQPFVENAVKHGIGQAGGESEIKIAFTKKDNMLLAVITDNGPGFSPTSAISNEVHKSVGSSLTKSRLDLLSGSPQGNSYIQENILGPDGEVLGARVEVRIPLD